MGYYDDIAPGYDALHKEEQLKKLLIILDGLEVKKEDRVLDVGCGTAFSFEILHPLGCKYQGLEPSEGLIKHSRYPTKITLASAEKIPFPDNLFTVVISVTALQNFTDPKQGLEEMRRVCSERMGLSFLKRSDKRDEFDSLIRDLFVVEKVIEEQRDLIYLCKSKP